LGVEEFVQKILSSRKDLTREELLEMIEKKKRGAKEFFTDEAAARIVALELGVEIVHKPLQLKVAIGDLVSGLSDVTVIGRVVAIRLPQTFTRQDQTEGKFARLIITDKSGTLQVVLWDDKTSLIEAVKIKLGQTVKVLHGYVREGLDGKPELHIGSRGRLQVLRPDITEKPLPIRLTKIGRLEPNMHDIDVLGRATEVGNVREFKRSRADVGHVSTLLIKDETGYVHLNLWEDKAFSSEDVKSGDVILARGAYTRKRFGKLNLNIGRLGTLIQNPEVAGKDKLPLCKEERTKIAEIRDEDGPITVKGVVASAPTMREAVTSKDERIAVVSFDLKDDTGTIGFSAWRTLANVAKDLTVGTGVRIRNAYVRKGFGDQLELTSHMFTCIDIMPPREEILS
jgi:ssDNA-binding replication factor A large subunit